MRRLAAGGAGLLVVVVLAIAQLVLPGIAAQHLRNQLARSGQVLEVQVHAFPAIELLWHQADTVVVRLGRYHPPTGRLAPALDQTGDVGTVRASAQELDSGLLTLHDVSLVKLGNMLTGTATIADEDLRSALPILNSVTPVASPGGGLTLQGTATLFGVTATVDATVSARNGRLVVAPDVPFGGFATLTLFSDAHVELRSVSASPVSGGFTVRSTALLR